MRLPVKVYSEALGCSHRTSPCRISPLTTCPTQLAVTTLDESRDCKYTDKAQQFADKW